MILVDGHKTSLQNTPWKCPVFIVGLHFTWLNLMTTHRQTWLFSSTSTYHSTDLLTACGVAHLVVHGTSGSTSYETIPSWRPSLATQPRWWRWCLHTLASSHGSRQTPRYFFCSPLFSTETRSSVRKPGDSKQTKWKERKVRWSTAVSNTPHCYGNSHAIWDQSVLLSLVCHAAELTFLPISALQQQDQNAGWNFPTLSPILCDTHTLLVSSVYFCHCMSL